MHKLAGRFDTKTFGLVIALDKSIKKDRDLFCTIRDYVIKNMFIGYKTWASAYRRIMICSIGDNLSAVDRDQQDVLKADLFLDIEIVEPPSTNLINILKADPNALVTVQLVDTKTDKVEEEFLINIQKKDGQILRSDSIV